MRALRFALLCCLLLVAGAHGSDELVLRLGNIQGQGWAAEGVEAWLDLRTNAGRLSLARLSLPAPLGELRALSVHCETLRLDGADAGCRGARLSARHPLLGEQDFGGELVLAAAGPALRLRDVPLVGGRVDIEAHLESGTWRIQGRGQGLDLAPLQAFAPMLTLAGGADASFHLSAAGDRIDGELELTLRKLALADEAGRLATDGLELELRLAVQADPGGALIRARASSGAGQLYLEPIFLDTGEHPFTAFAQGVWDGESLELAELRLEQPGALHLRAHGSYSQTEGLRRLGLLLQDGELDQIYPLYLQPFLIGTPADELTAAGELELLLDWKDGAPTRLELHLDEGRLSDGRLSLSGLSARLNWLASPDSSAPISRLAWRTGSLLGMELGPAELALRLTDRDLRLLEPARFPILDGALVVNDLRAEAVGEPDMRLGFDGRLEPLDMRRLTRALGWSEFSGSLGGRLPPLSYENGVLSLGGALVIEAFDGRLSVEGLRLAQPFGRQPRLAADIRLRGLDLRRLTDTFAFGRITGRLDGDIERLRLVNWQPAAFEARFYTPPDDRSSHRISQRAIENISSIGGGGAAAVLSRGFLSLFESFAYDRIGLSCQLSEDVCLMGGIGPAPGGEGYYIVRGRLLPRVDVIGFQRRVSWSTLIEQLKSVTEADQAVVR